MTFLVFSIAYSMSNAVFILQHIKAFASRRRGFNVYAKCRQHYENIIKIFTKLVFSKIKTCSVYIIRVCIDIFNSII